MSDHTVSAPGAFLRGLAMGAADIVPGVSGGTIALVTGIYDRLITSLSAFDLDLLRLLRQGRWRRGWKHVDGAFLVALAAGILSSVLTLARGIAFLLERYPLQLWGAFFGLILGSALTLAWRVGAWNASRVLAFTAAALLAAGSLLLPAAAGDDSALAFFAAGALAICAMVLPGVSGSFVLVLLGMYPLVLEAVRDFHWLRLGCFAAGAAVGLLSFTRLLRWLLERHHALTVALLTGFLAGSLAVVWPWKLADGRVAAAGVRALPVTPGHYEAVTGSAEVLPVLALMACATALVVFVDRRWGGDGT